MRTLIWALLWFFCVGSVSLAAETVHWVEVRSPHFVVLTDAGEKQGRKIAGQFEQMREVFHLLVPKATGDAGVQNVVLALREKKDFDALEPPEYLKKHQLTLAGFFSRTPEKAFIVLRIDAQQEHPFATVYHEYTHELMSKSPWVPLWMNEGLAEFYQNTDIRENEVMLGQASIYNIEFLREHTLLPLKTLLAVDYKSPYYHEEDKGTIFYTESWGLMHYLVLTDFQNRTSHLQEYATYLVKGEDSVTAAEHAFGDLTVLQNNLFLYLQHLAFNAFKVKQAFPIDVESIAAKPLTEPEANAVRAEVLVDVGRTKEAEDLLTTCLRDDPNSALAHEVMGQIRLRAKDIEGARKWYGEAVKLDSQSYLAHYYFASMTMRAGDRDQDAAIEASLREAIKLKPDFAPPYDALAQYYQRRNERLDEAYRLSLQAVQLEPEQLAYRMNAANILVQQKNYASAEKVLENALKVAKTPEENSMVQLRITQLEEHQGGAAQSQSQRVEAASRRVSAPPDGTGAQDNGAKSLVFKTVDGKTIGMISDAPAMKFPEGDAKGPKHTVRKDPRRSVRVSVGDLVYAGAGVGQADGSVQQQFLQDRVHDGEL